MHGQACHPAHPGYTARVVARGMALAGAVMLGALAGFPAGAQTDSGGADEGAAAAEMELAEVDAYRLGLLKMRGHLSVARALVQVGAEGADYHMGPALARLHEDIAPALAERGAPVSGGVLDELANAGGLEAHRALPAIESGVQAVNGSFAQTGAMDRGSVLGLVEALLRAAVANYAEAVSDNEVTDLRKYQTGRGFVIQAEALVRNASALADAPGQEELVKVVTLIRQAWPGIMPPPIVFDPEDVARRLDEAVAIMQGMR